MKRRIASSLLLALASSVTAFAQDDTSFDGYYNYLAGQQYPNGSEVSWATNVQGIANDDTYWFITNNHSMVNLGFIRRIHWSQDLVTGSSLIVDTVPLFAFGYHFVKELDAYQAPNGETFVVVAVQGDSSNDDAAGLAIYNDSLQLIGVIDLTMQNSVPWIAVDADGYLFTSTSTTSVILRYDNAWVDLVDMSGTPGNPVHFQLNAAVEEIPILSHCNSSVPIHHLQGGDFAPGDEKLYIVTGHYDHSVIGHGIHVYERSGNGYVCTKNSTQTAPFFRYQWNQTCSFPNYYCEEPQGITFWDLTDRGVPNVTGEMHVLLLDNDEQYGLGHDDVYLKHYTRNVYVDSTSGAGSGDPTSPWPTVSQALSQLFGGSELFEDMVIRILPGSYAESVTIDRRVLLTAPSGPVVIGS